MAQYQIYFDTLEGEKKYDVDIGDDELLEAVLRDILVELAERGHMMRGLSTGDLKVIWGGRDGRELDLTCTLPQQGVRPNEVLRVLVEIYEGGAGSLRSDRIDKEWDLLERLAALNPGQLRLLERGGSPVETRFRLRLQESPGVAGASGTDLQVRDIHTLTLVYPRFYPDVPIEAYVEEPLFHPNVKPETGFVCLWEQASARHTAVQAVARAQAMAAFRMVNLGSAHVMNKQAAEWYGSVAQPRQLVPLTWAELRVFEVRGRQMCWLEPGRSWSQRPAPRLR